MLVNEIFNSIDGEGIRAGELATFIRFCGCNMHCKYCDTKYSWGKDGKEMSIGEILNWISKNGFHNITITGGEPLIQNNIDELVRELLNNNHSVNIETNGSLDPQKVLEKSYGDANLIITMDYKTQCSGEEDKMNIDNFTTLTDKDVLKFVVANKDEMITAKRFMHKLDCLKHGDRLPTVYFSPVFGAIEPKEIVEFMLENRLSRNCRVQLQLHKFIWEPNKRGV